MIVSGHVHMSNIEYLLFLVAKKYGIMLFQHRDEATNQSASRSALTKSIMMKTGLIRLSTIALFYFQQPWTPITTSDHQ